MRIFSKIRKEKFSKYHYSNNDCDFCLEEVIKDRLRHLKIPIVFGFSLGHVADKPTLPLGIEVTLDADNRKLIFEEAAVAA